MEKYIQYRAPSPEELAHIMPILNQRVGSEMTNELRERITQLGGERFFQEYKIEYIYTIDAIRIQDFLEKLSNIMLSSETETIEFGFLCFIAYILDIKGIYGIPEYGNIEHRSFLEYAVLSLREQYSQSLRELGESLYEERSLFLPTQKHLRIVEPKQYTSQRIQKVVDNTRRKPPLKLIISHP